MEIRFIVNPISGNANNTRYAGHLIDLIGKRGMNVTTSIHVLQRRGEASEYAAEEARRIVEAGRTDEVLMVSVGGDGTINEIASAIAGSGVSVGIIARGSGNGLARSLHLPHKAEEQVDYLLNGRKTKIDHGRIGDRKFFCTAGFGFESDIAFLFDKTGGKHRGKEAYLKHIASEILNYKGVMAKVELDGEVVEGRFLTFCFANANQYGNNAFIAPEASLQDGLLSVTMIRPFPFALAGIEGAALMGGYIDKLPNVETRLVKEARILELEDDRFHCDGEPVRMSVPTDVSIESGALSVWVKKDFAETSCRVIDPQEFTDKVSDISAAVQERLKQSGEKVQKLPQELRTNLRQLARRYFSK